MSPGCLSWSEALDGFRGTAKTFLIESDSNINLIFKEENSLREFAKRASSAEFAVSGRWRLPVRELRISEKIIIQNISVAVFLVERRLVIVQSQTMSIVAVL